MTGPEGNSEFCFPRISMFPETNSEFCFLRISMFPRDEVKGNIEIQGKQKLFTVPQGTSYLSDFIILLYSRFSCDVIIFEN